MYENCLNLNSVLKALAMFVGLSPFCICLVQYSAAHVAVSNSVSLFYVDLYTSHACVNQGLGREI